MEPFTSNRKQVHNLGTWPKGDKRSFTFDQPGVVPLLCNVHPEMSGYIVISPTPYFVETDASGNFKIDNVPDGKYSVVAWHEGSKPQAKSVVLHRIVVLKVNSRPLLDNQQMRFESQALLAHDWFGRGSRECLSRNTIDIDNRVAR
jgi:hypothetical protein